jgi:hypothetical protein
MSRIATGPGWRSLAALAAAPLAWMVHHQLGSDLNYADCHRGTNPVVAAIGLCALLAALIACAITALDFRAERAGSQHPGTGMRRFMAAFSLMLGALLTLTIAVQVMASLVVPACFR